MEFIKRKGVQIFSLCFGLVIAAFLTQITAAHFAKKASQEILIPLAKADSIQFDILKTAIIEDTPQRKILKNQYYVCQQVKLYYNYLSKSYYINYYSFSICSIAFTTLLTISLFLIATNGWQNSNPFLQSFFLTTVAITSVYYFLPNVLNSKENFHKNVEKVKAFQKIQLDILAFSSISNSVSKMNIDSAVSNYYKQISNNYDLITTIDNSKIDSNPQDIIKKLK